MIYSVLYNSKVFTDLPYKQRVTRLLFVSLILYSLFISICLKYKPEYKSYFVLLCIIDLTFLLMTMYILKPNILDKPKQLKLPMFNANINEQYRNINSNQMNELNSPALSESELLDGIYTGKIKMTEAEKMGYVLNKLKLDKLVVEKQIIQGAIDINDVMQTDYKYNLSKDLTKLATSTEEPTEEKTKLKDETNEKKEQDKESIEIPVYMAKATRA